MAVQVTRKLLEGDDMQELKIKFYKLMIEYHSLCSEKDAFEIAQHYHHIYDTPIIKVSPLTNRNTIAHGGG